MAWSVLRWVGRLRPYLTSGWRATLLWFAVPTAVLWAIDRSEAFGFDAVFSPGWIVTVIVAVLLARGIWNARHRIVVEAFVDHTGDSTEARISGLNTLLITELDWLTGLYARLRAERASLLGEPQAVQASVTLDDASEFLRGAVTTEAKLSVGPLALPLGMLLGLFSRLVQGPRLVGSVHESDGQLIVVCQLIRRGGSRVWKSSAEDAVGDGADDTLEGLVRQVVCQLFTSESLGDAVSWRAVWWCNQGLERYQATLHRKERRLANLQAACRHFTRALAEDQGFVGAYHGLGLAYQAMNSDAARAAFTTAIQCAPERWEPYFALATYHFEREDFQKVIELCRVALPLVDDPQAKATMHNLHGLAQRRENDLQGATESRRQAARYGLRSLLRAELAAGPGVSRHREEAYHFLMNLAVAHAYQGERAPTGRDEHYATAEAALSFATAIASSDPVLVQRAARAHVERAEVAVARRRAQRAVEHLEKAVQRNPGLEWAWAHLALQQAALDRPEDAARTRARALDHLRTAPEAVLERVLRACVQMGDTDLAPAVQRILDARALLEEAEGEGCDKADLRARLGRFADDTGDWEHGWRAYVLSRICLDPPERAALLREAIARLTEDEVRRHGIRVQLARVLHQQKDTAAALQELEAALELDPTHVFEHRALAEMLEDLSDFEQSFAAYEHASLWGKAESPELKVRRAILSLKLAMATADRDRWRSGFHEAERCLLEALGLYPNHELRGRGWAHHWLGYVYASTQRNADAILHFNAAKGLGFEPLTTTLLTARCELDSSMYANSLAHFREVVQALEEVVGDGSAGRRAFEPAAVLPMTACELYAYGLIGQSECEVERDVQGPGSRERLQKTAKYINRIADETARDACKARRLAVEGRIRCKEGATGEAVSRLEQSARLDPVERTHLSLAEALSQQAEECPTGAERVPILRKAREHLRHVVELDRCDHLADRVRELRGRIDRLDRGPAAEALVGAAPFGLDGHAPGGDAAEGDGASPPRPRALNGGGGPSSRRRS